MRRLAARLFASAYRRFRSALSRLVRRGGHRPRELDRRSRLLVAPLETRDHTGNLVGGMAVAALGGHLADPLQAMAAAVGDFALLAAPHAGPASSPVTAGDPPAPVTHWLPPDLRSHAFAGSTITVSAGPNAARPADDARPRDPRDDFWNPVPDSGDRPFRPPVEPAAAGGRAGVEDRGGAGRGGNGGADGDVAGGTSGAADAMFAPPPASSSVGSEDSGTGEKSAPLESGDVPGRKDPGGEGEGGGPLDPGGEGGEGGEVEEEELPVVPGVLVVAADETASETGTSKGLFRFQRVGPIDASLTVTFSVGGSAWSDAWAENQDPEEDSDYSLTGSGVALEYDEDTGVVTGTVVIPADARTAAVTVFPEDDLEIEGDENIVVTVLPPEVEEDEEPAYSVDDRTYTATVTLDDDESAAPPADTLGGPGGPVVSIRAADPNLCEGGGTAAFEVRRDGDTTDPLTVYYKILDKSTRRR
jgi:hypothetical protein